MADIVERLRDEAETEPTWTSAHRLYVEAADTITALRLQLQEARREALEEAAKVGRAWLVDWGIDLQGTADAYRDAMETGLFGGRAISRDIAKAHARSFQERSDAVYDCGEGAAAAIRALGDKG